MTHFTPCLLSSSGFGEVIPGLMGSRGWGWVHHHFSTREQASQLFKVLKSVGRHRGFSAGLLIGGRKGVDTEKERVNELEHIGLHSRPSSPVHG